MKRFFCPFPQCISSFEKGFGFLTAPSIDFAVPSIIRCCACSSLLTLCRNCATLIPASQSEMLERIIETSGEKELSSMSQSQTGESLDGIVCHLCGYFNLCGNVQFELCRTEPFCFTENDFKYVVASIQSCLNIQNNKKDSVMKGIPSFSPPTVQPFGNSHLKMLLALYNVSSSESSMEVRDVDDSFSSFLSAKQELLQCKKELFSVEDAYWGLRCYIRKHIQSSTESKMKTDETDTMATMVQIDPVALSQKVFLNKLNYTRALWETKTKPFTSFLAKISKILQGLYRSYKALKIAPKPDEKMEDEIFMLGADLSTGDCEENESILCNKITFYRQLYHTVSSVIILNR